MFSSFSAISSAIHIKKNATPATQPFTATPSGTYTYSTYNDTLNPGYTYSVYIFTAGNSNTLTLTGVSSSITLSILAVGGGGGGGGSNVTSAGGTIGGAGGAGGVVSLSQTISTNDTITINVGSGGAGSTTTIGTQGGNTSVKFAANTSANLIAYGGGYGGTYGSSAGGNGASGGASGRDNGGIVSGKAYILDAQYNIIGNIAYNETNASTGSILGKGSQGYAAGSHAAAGNGAGAGGAGGIGVAATNGTSGSAGGQGIQSTLLGLGSGSTNYRNYYWGGGGGSSAQTSVGGNGGIGGGGGGSMQSGNGGSGGTGGGTALNSGSNGGANGGVGGNGGANTGGGGGGGAGNGGSGIVIIAIPQLSTVYNAVPTNYNSIQFADTAINTQNPSSASLTVNASSNPLYTKQVGTYIAKASSADNGTVSAPFRNNSAGWGTWYNNAGTRPYSGGTYNTSTGNFYTNITGVGNYSGEWVQITLPNLFILDYFTLTPGSSDRFPSNFYVVGTNSPTITSSSSGNNTDSAVAWTNLYYSSSQSSPGGNITFDSTNTLAFNTYRLCINKITGTSQNALCSINGFQIFGKYQ